MTPQLHHIQTKMITGLREVAGDRLVM